MNTINYNVDKNGYYGEFGGAFIPDVLKPNVDALREAYLKVIETEEFKKEFESLLRDYVGRPSPLYFAKRLSQKYNTKIYLKREDLNHTGSHKINNTIGQILLAKHMGKHRVIAETGAGQHGVATATVCALMDMECVIYMGEVDIKRQFLNVQKMKMLGAEVVSVTRGNRTLADAVDEALDQWVARHEDTFYLLGSAVGPHPYPDMVARFQSIISEEIKKQLQQKEGRDYPDYLIACVGGGSNAIGTFYHYINDMRANIIIAEAGGMGAYSGKTAATLTIGKQGILHGFKSLVMLDNDGNLEEPYSISAGLDYPGVGPAHANMVKNSRAEVFAITDAQAIDAAFELTEIEGIIPAIESSHALAVFAQKKFKPTDVIVLTVSGRGDKDMDAYIEAFDK